MANEKGADQTERPTPKRLKDARRDGEVNKSRELTRTALLLLWLMMAWMLAPFMYRRVSLLFEQSLSAITAPFDQALATLSLLSIQVLLWLTVPFLLASVVLGAFVEYLQVGAVFAPSKVKPNAEHLNPAAGLKRMFSLRNVVEVVKSVVKATILIGLLVLVLRSLVPDFLALTTQPPIAMASAFWKGVVRLCIWVIFLFFFVSVLDAGYQRFEYIKKLKMSRRDIRQEVKENEGDPMIKGQRKRLHQEWAQQNMLHSVRRSNVVVTNPTHIAIALRYDPEDTDLPVVVAKGEDYEARLIREAAEEAGVPILRDVQLARGLHEKIDLEQFITDEFFVAVAEVLRWADSIAQRHTGEHREDSS